MFPSRLALPHTAATHQLGAELGQVLPAGSVLLLQGNLGAGKTTFVQGLAQGLGIADAVVSPTFILLSEYLEGRVPLYHFDLYRLETPAAVRSLQVESYWEGLEVEPGVVAIEWAERLPDLPENYWELTFSLGDVSGAISEPGRVIHWKAVGPETLEIQAPWQGILERWVSSDF
jgi:tRNA threonylcarbamoyladenosine biosynthesis protein TsaE